MYIPRPAEYDDPIYGTGHADYRKETGFNEFTYYPPTGEAEGVAS